MIQIKIKNLKNTVSKCDQEMAVAQKNKDKQNWFLFADIRLDALEQIAKLKKLNK